MKVEISIFNEDEQYYDHYGYYDSTSDAIKELYNLFFNEMEEVINE